MLSVLSIYWHQEKKQWKGKLPEAKGEITLTRMEEISNEEKTVPWGEISI